MPGAIVARGERLTLRTLERADVPFIQRCSANPEIRHPTGSRVKDQVQLDDVGESDADRFVVCLDGDEAGPGGVRTEDVTRLGTVSVHDASYKRPELRYWLIPEYHGRGYGAEAVALAVDYVFRTYDTPAVEAGVYDFNDASIGLLESLGFTREGRLRRFMFVDGAHRDMLQYGLLREEWGGGEWRESE